jgi:hypothetical protein
MLTIPYFRTHRLLILYKFQMLWIHIDIYYLHELAILKATALSNLELDLHHTHNYGPFLGQCYLLDPACTSTIATPKPNARQL